MGLTRVSTCPLAPLCSLWAPLSSGAPWRGRVGGCRASFRRSALVLPPAHPRLQGPFFPARWRPARLAVLGESSLGLAQECRPGPALWPPSHSGLGCPQGRPSCQSLGALRASL